MSDNDIWLILDFFIHVYVKLWLSVILFAYHVSSKNTT